MCVALEEGGDEWRFGLRRGFSLLSVYRDVDEASAEIPKAYKAENNMLFGVEKAKYPEQDLSRVQCCCLDVQRAGPRGCPWSSIRHTTE